jgi:cobalt transporter subunit CbtB
MQRQSAVGNPTHTATTSAQQATWLPALLAASLGLLLLWGVGFSHIDAVHNAAHDMRHSNAFPCH